MSLRVVLVNSLIIEVSHGLNFLLSRLEFIFFLHKVNMLVHQLCDLIEYIFFIGWLGWGRIVKIWLLSENVREKRNGIAGATAEKKEE